MNNQDIKPLPSVEEIIKNRIPLVDVNQKQKENLSSIDKLALWITDHVGSMGFFLIIFIWTVFWLGWNVFAPKELTFDPHPAFVLWLFISNMIQIFLMPLIMIGQNLQSRHAERRADADYEINVRSAHETTKILDMLNTQNKLLKEISNKL
jgi:uncharacterized membrane protein